MAQTEIHATDNAETAQDRRADPRVTLLIRAARLVVDGRDHLCVVRDISSGGATIRLFHDLPHGAELALALDGPDLHPLDPVWEKRDHLGVRFRAPVRPEAWLEAAREPLMLGVTMEAVVRFARHAMPARLTAIGLQSITIACPEPLLAGEDVQIETALVTPLGARVLARPERTAMGHVHTMALDRPFRIDELARAVQLVHAAQGAGLGLGPLFVPGNAAQGGLPMRPLVRPA